MNKEIYFNIHGIIDRITITEKNTSNDLKCNKIYTLVDTMCYNKCY